MSVNAQAHIETAKDAHRTLFHQGRPARTADVHPHAGLNRLIAVAITNRIGSMWAAYLFALLALISLPAAIASHDAIVIVAWIAQTFLQLVLLPVIMVGQNVQAAAGDARQAQVFEITQSLHAINIQQLQLLEQQATILKRLDMQPPTPT